MGSRRSEIHSVSVNANPYEYDEGLEVTLEKAAQIISNVIRISDEEKEMIKCLNQS
ncbi:MAG: hypothetical protein K1W41_17180 [Lachnospiraceae bacterium]